MKSNHILRMSNLLVVCALVLAACGAPATSQPTAMPAATEPPAATMAPTEEMVMPTDTAEMAPTEETMTAPTSKTGAADLRVALDSLLSEHVYLAVSATGAALGGRAEQFEAAAAALDANSVDLSKAIGSVYGADAEAAFLPLWRSHISFVVEYTQALAADDQAAADKSVNDLLAYAEDFGAFLSGANPNLTKEAVAELVTMHITTLKTVIDAQAAGDIEDSYTARREAFHHMGMMAETLAGAIATQFPDKYSGDASSPAADLRAGLNSLLAEHAYLAAYATGAALGGRNDEFEVAAATLDTNSVDLSEAIGSVYGTGAGDAFLPLWRSHIGFFVDYTVAIAGDDQAAADEAVNDLVGYTQDFGAFLNSANPALPVDTVAELVEMHVLTLKDVVDAQKAGDQPLVYSKLREAYHHMSMIADPLAESIVVQFPEKFQ